MRLNVLPVAVLGGGPAGMSAALWLNRQGHQPVIFEAHQLLGGLQRTSNYPNPYLLGFPGHTANVIADLFARHLDTEQIRTLHARVDGLSAAPTHLTVHANGRKLEVAAAVACFGTRWRPLDVPGAADAVRARTLRFLGHGSDVHDALGQRVVVIGGGDNALATAVEVGRYAKSLLVLSRSPVTCLRILRTAASALAHVEIRVGHEVVAAEPGRLEVQGPGGPYRLDYDLGWITIGFLPNTEELRTWLPGLQADAAGYLKVDADCRTSVQRLWAAGDICNPVHPCTATAVAMGTMAARDIEKTLREAPATVTWSLRAAPMPTA
jgi:thioredoxin reductase (NADPH)